MIENNIFEGITYLYISLNIVSKQFKHNLNLQHILFILKVEYKVI